MPNLLTLTRRQSRLHRPSPARLQEIYGTDQWIPKGSGARAALRFLAEYRYLTREMLALLMREEEGRTSGQQVAQHLVKLWRFSYVNRFPRPTDRGSSQYVYALTQRGARKALDDEAFEARRFQLLNAVKPKAGYDHALTVILFRILWDLGVPQFPSDLLTEGYWFDQDTEGRGERGKTRNQFAARLDGRAVFLRPDSTIWAVWKHQKAPYRPLFLEIERTHKNEQRTVKRFRAYEALLINHRDGIAKVYQKHLHSGTVPGPGMVFFLAANASHRDHLLALAQKHTPSTRSRILDFTFASIEDLFEYRCPRRDCNAVVGVHDAVCGRCSAPLLDPESGRRHARELIIGARDFFTRPFAVHLSGKPRAILPEAK